jgi:hypothetical protein
MHREDASEWLCRSMRGIYVPPTRLWPQMDQEFVSHGNSVRRTECAYDITDSG